jgi:trans-aconitate methyltransferase
MVNQAWSASAYNTSARFVSDLGRELVDWLDPKPGERVLDLGCGDGALTVQLVERGARVTAVDASPSMIEASRRLGLDARVVDGHDLPFENEFEAVFSNAALHWMERPNAVIAGVRKALVPEGRFVAEMGGFGCVAAIRSAMIAVGRSRGVDPTLADPWFFPTVESYERRLVAGGFAVERIVTFSRPTPLPETGIRGWLRVFREPFFEQFPEGPEREDAIDDVIAALAPLRDPNGRWVADYVRLRFEARRA